MSSDDDASAAPGAADADAPTLLSEAQRNEIVDAVKQMVKAGKRYSAVLHGWDLKYNLRKTGTAVRGDMCAIDPRDGQKIFSQIALKRKLQVAVEPSDGCSPNLYQVRVRDKVALLHRGGCGFGEKCQAAQKLGAIAVAVVNSDDSLNRMMVAEAEEALIKIPAVMITQSAGDAIMMIIRGWAQAQGHQPSAASGEKRAVSAPEMVVWFERTGGRTNYYFADSESKVGVGGDESGCSCRCSL